MTFSAMLSEAWRNVISGTARVAALIGLFTVLVGLAVAADAMAAIQIVDAARSFRNAGATTEVLQAEKGIDPSACERLADVTSVNAAGAVRESSAITLDMQPDAPVSQYEVTSGMKLVLGVDTVEDGGVWIPEPLASDWGIDIGDSLASDQGAVTVAGIYPYPNDGRVGTFSFAVLSPTWAAGEFDMCWAKMWPYSADTRSLVLTSVKGEYSGKISQIQLNSSLGKATDGAAQFDSRMTRWALVACPVIGAIIAFLAVRRRKLQHGAALHAGVSRASISTITMMETLAWAGLGALAVLAVLTIIAAPADIAFGYFIGVHGVAIGFAVLGALAGSWLAVATIRERYLFHYFRNR